MKEEMAKNSNIIGELNVLLEGAKKENKLLNENIANKETDFDELCNELEKQSSEIGELKKEIALAYLSGKGSFGSLAKDYGIPDKRQVCKWVKAYQKLGDAGLRRSRSKNKYSFEYKILINCIHGRYSRQSNIR